MAAPVPDTGQTKCYNDSVEITCPSPGQAFYGQDASYSINPMSYTKLDGSGVALPDSAASWVMVKDNVTGLIWENKTVDGTIHDMNKTFTWYDSNPATNGGDPGTPGTGTDTENFITSLNNANFGSQSDWRLPSVCELNSLLNTSYSPPINTVYFPNTVSSIYWSSTTNAYYTSGAWGTDFYFGNGSHDNKSVSYCVHAVRGVQTGSFGNLIISINPPIQNEGHGSGSTTFSVSSNAGRCSSSTGTTITSSSIHWLANLTLGIDWIVITKGSSGTNSGAISCGFIANTGTFARSGALTVTSSDTCPVIVFVTQAAPNPSSYTLSATGLLTLPHIEDSTLYGSIIIWANMQSVTNCSPPNKCFQVTNYGLSSK